MNARFLPLLLIAGVFSACSSKSSELVEPVQSPVELKKEVMTDVAYGTGERNKMDVYLPEKRGNTTPFIILMHGGAWVGGDKKELSVLQDSLCNRGIASVNINYSYVSADVHLPQIMAEVNQALTYSRTNAAKWALNLDKVAIGGVSSGAQLAMMFAYSYETSGSIDCLISGAGPTMIDDRDFLNGAIVGNGIQGVNDMVGAIYSGGDIDPKFTQASPIKNLKNIPILMIHGTADQVVPYQHSLEMNSALQSAGFTHELITLEGTNHDLNLGTPASATKVYQEMSRWIKTYEK